MKTLTFILAWLSVALAVAAAGNDQATKCSKWDPADYAEEDVIVRDVAVIGGGSSGTYGAINLRLKGQSVVLVEKQALLGGHTNTYTDPGTGTTIDYGVQAWYNITTTRDFFAHFNIPIAPYTFDKSKPVYADFKTGQQIAFNGSTNFSAYGEQLAKYPYIEYSWDLPNPVPSDLLLPFSKFVSKYNLQDVAYNVYFNSQGLSNILKQLTINVFKIFDSSYISAIGGSFVTTANHNNSELYSKAADELGADALLSSTVICAQRPDGNSSSGTNSTNPGIRLIVSSPSGSGSGKKNKLILASKLLVSIPPLTSNIAPFAPDARESALFSKWHYSGYYTLLINNTGFPPGYRYLNAAPLTSANDNIPALPAPYQITETAVPDIYYVWYGSPGPLSQKAVQDDVVASVQRLRNLGGANATNATQLGPPNFLAFQSHTPFKLVVSADELAAGFYARLNALQGYRRTWYTGAAIISHNSGKLWNFTEALLPEIVAA